MGANTCITEVISEIKSYHSYSPIQNVIQLLNPISWKMCLVLRNFFFFFLVSQVQHREVSRLGIKSELQLLTYATATVSLDLSHICNLLHSLDP